jgi:hypothetical protein
MIRKSICQEVFLYLFFRDGQGSFMRGERCGELLDRMFSFLIAEDDVAKGFSFVNYTEAISYSIAEEIVVGYRSTERSSLPQFYLTDPTLGSDLEKPESSFLGYLWGYSSSSPNL